ncbi:MAG: flagellar biosynthesis protein FlhF [Methylomonas sp.]
MKIKRFFAADIRQAMRMVKEELGADAVIMSNRSVDGGVEIVAARDFDEQVIHKNLQQQREEAKAAALKKVVDLPDFAGDKKPAHLLSSARKRGNETENPIRRNLDQYIGYAEKLQIAGVATQKPASQKIKLPEKPAWAASEQKVKPVSEPMKSAPQTASSEHFMEEMRKEMKDLRALLDSKLSGLAGQPQQNAQPVREVLLKSLVESGFSLKLSTKIANRLGSHKQVDLAIAKAKEMLAKVVPIADDDLLERGGIAALVGPTGVGKTTTIAKLAAQFILKHGSRDVALITTDNYRIGAHEQLSIYGRILGVPVKVANDADELRQHIHDCADKRLILIDTAGMSQRDMRLADQIKTLKHDDLPIRSYLVMSATGQYRSVMEIMDAFQILEPQAAILTKLDEAVCKGMALSAIIERRMPLSFVTNGQEVPEDIYAPEADALIQECVASGDTENVYTDELTQEDWMAENYA